jgi:hypothetical protein
MRTTTLQDRRDSVERLTKAVTKAEAMGNANAAEVLREMLCRAENRLRVHESLRRYGPRDGYVRVGDHTPERRVNHDHDIHRADACERVPYGVHFPGRDPTAGEII